jgi:hypothetical protein
MATTAIANSNVCASGAILSAAITAGTKTSSQSRGFCRTSFSKRFMAGASGDDPIAGIILRFKCGEQTLIRPCILFCTQGCGCGWRPAPGTSSK